MIFGAYPKARKDPVKNRDVEPNRATVRVL